MKTLKQDLHNLKDDVNYEPSTSIYNDKGELIYICNRQKVVQVYDVALVTQKEFKHHEYISFSHKTPECAMLSIIDYIKNNPLVVRCNNKVAYVEFEIHLMDKFDDFVTIHSIITHEQAKVISRRLKIEALL
jgi:hypothetical protein